MRLPIIVAAAVFLSPGVLAAAESYWNTTIGLMIVDRQESEISGSYEGESDGIFVGTVQPDGTIDAVWFESGDVDRCAVEEAGSANWGRWQLVPHKDQFTAYRSYCDEPLPTEVNLWRECWFLGGRGPCRIGIDMNRRFEPSSILLRALRLS